MARRYFRRYRRGRRYSRKRYPRKRYLRGIDRNSFCIVDTENVTYTFGANQTIGIPNKFINFGMSEASIGGTTKRIAVSVLGNDKFKTLAKLYDQVRLKGMSVKISYVAATGLSAQTLNLVTMVDRCGFDNEIYNIYGSMIGDSTQQQTYLEKIENASSRRKISLTGGKTAYFYYYPVNMQEKMFMNINADGTSATEGGNYYILGIKGSNFNNFNPCIYSYIEKSAAAETEQTSVVVNVEVKYYVEFRSSC